MPRQIRVPVCPGMDDPECRAKAEDALDRRNHVDYKCYLMLREMVEGKKIPRDDAADLIKERDDVNDEFLKAVAGKI